MPGENKGIDGQVDVDISKKFAVKGAASDPVHIGEGERLRFARHLLFCLLLICVGVFIARGKYPDNKGVSDIFELIKIGALPLVTLVISFYFPNKTAR